jgi:hypothetical protein
MRTTLNLPRDILNEALRVTHCRTKTMVILLALQNLIQKEKLKKLKDYRGRLNLEVDLNKLRCR